MSSTHIKQLLESIDKLSETAFPEKYEDMTPMQKGFHDSHRKGFSAVNPFPAGTKEHKEWQFGYDDFESQKRAGQYESVSTDNIPMAKVDRTKEPNAKSERYYAGKIKAGDKVTVNGSPAVFVRHAGARYMVVNLDGHEALVAKSAVKESKEDPYSHVEKKVFSILNKSDKSKTKTMTAAKLASLVQASEKAGTLEYAPVSRIRTYTQKWLDAQTSVTEAARPVAPNKKANFRKISLDEFERIVDSAEDYFSSEIDLHRVYVAIEGGNVRALYYPDAQTGTASDNFVGDDYLEFSERDPYWPFEENNVAEAVNSQGDKTYQTWGAWKRACAVAGADRIDAKDEDGIAYAWKGDRQVGDWGMDSEFGTVYAAQVAEGGLTDLVKRGVKSVKRGMQGWGGKGLAITGDENGPKDIVNRVKALDDEGVKSLHKFVQKRAAPYVDKGPTHSPAGFQKRVLDREMKKRGLNEDHWSEEDLDAAIVDLVKSQFGGQAWFKGGDYAYLIDVNDLSTITASDGAKVTVQGSLIDTLYDYCDRGTVNDFAEDLEYDPEYAKEYFRAVKQSPALRDGGPKWGSEQERHELDNMGLGEGKDESTIAAIAKAGTPDVKVGDQIRTRKMAMIGVVTKITPGDKFGWGSDAIYFRVDDGRTMRTPASNIVVMSKKPAEPITNEDVDSKFELTPEQIDEIKELLSAELPVGVDGVDAINALAPYFDDEELSDKLSALAEENPEQDSVPAIKEFLSKVAPELSDQLGDTQEEKEVAESAISQLKTLAGL